MEIVVADRFKIKKKINEGAFGEIYLALNNKNGQEVAVKFENQTTKYPQVLMEAKIMLHILKGSTVTDKGIILESFCIEILNPIIFSWVSETTRKRFISLILDCRKSLSRMESISNMKNRKI